MSATKNDLVFHLKIYAQTFPFKNNSSYVKQRTEKNNAALGFIFFPLAFLQAGFRLGREKYVSFEPAFPTCIIFSNCGSLTLLRNLI